MVHEEHDHKPLVLDCENRIVLRFLKLRLPELLEQNAKIAIIAVARRIIHCDRLELFMYKNLLGSDHFL